ncbi:MAG: hypothetical protein CMI54_02425 [Parcubacteria group bacterium]|jgi:hypothetical protein|nr:hypothetical protein [Parcubacteria group bacterium]|tara:strand:+ start:18489 stop:18770 length:282 start_codon:yes stop_codon:yes gene_type:complete
MSIELYVDFYADKTEKWYRFKEIVDVCHKSEIDPPEEVEEFFGHEFPEDDDVQGEMILVEEGYVEFENEQRYGFMVDLKKLPEEVRFIRFSQA